MQINPGLAGGDAHLPEGGRRPRPGHVDIRPGDFTFGAPARPAWNILLNADLKHGHRALVEPAGRRTRHRIVAQADAQAGIRQPTGGDRRGPGGVHAQFAGAQGRRVRAGLQGLFERQRFSLDRACDEQGAAAERCGAEPERRAAARPTGR